MSPSYVLTMIFAVIVLVGFIALYIYSSIRTRKKYPTYHYDDNEFTNVCVYKQYRRYGEYRIYRFRKQIDGKYKFEFGLWFGKFILKLIVLDVFLALALLGLYYYQTKSLSSIDLLACCGVLVLFSIIIWFSEWISVLRAKHYLRNSMKQ